MDSLDLLRSGALQDVGNDPRPPELNRPLRQGLAPGRGGARLGHGRGYYDRLLADVRPDAPLVALAFECQIFPQIPTEPHDVCMDKVITEKAVYQK